MLSPSTHPYVHLHGQEILPHDQPKSTSNIFSNIIFQSYRNTTWYLLYLSLCMFEVIKSFIFILFPKLNHHIPSPLLIKLIFYEILALY